MPQLAITAAAFRFVPRLWPATVLLLALAGGAFLGAGTRPVGPQSAVFLLAGGVAVALAACDAAAGMAMLLSLVVVVSRHRLWELSIPLFGGGLKPTDVLIAAIVGGWLLRAGLGFVDSSRLSNVFALLTLGFLAWNAMGAVRGIGHGIPYKDSLLEFRPLLSYLLVFPVLTEFDNARIRRILNVVLLASFAVAGQAVYYHLRGVGEVVTASGALRVRAVNFSYLVVALLVAVALYAACRLNLPATLAVGVAASFGIAITAFRSAALAIVAGLVFLAVGAGRPGRARLAGVLALGAAVTLLVAATGAPRRNGLLPAAIDRITSIASYRADVSAQHRLREWAAVAGVVARHPIAGAGLGSRVVFFSPEYSEQSQVAGRWSSDFFVHNSYLWAAAKTGCVGLVLLLGLVLAPLIAGARRLAGEDADAESRSLLLACGSAAAGLLVLSVFGPTLTSLNEAPFGAFVLAATWICGRRDAAARALRPT